MFEALRYIIVDLFNLSRDMLQSVSFGDFDLYDFFISIIMIFVVFKIARAIIGEEL